MHIVTTVAAVVARYKSVTTHTEILNHEQCTNERTGRERRGRDTVAERFGEVWECAVIALVLNSFRSDAAEPSVAEVVPHQKELRFLLLLVAGPELMSPKF